MREKKEEEEEEKVPQLTERLETSGPPPPLRLPSGVTILGDLPEWPEITIGTDKKLTYPTEPATESCTKPTPPASICSVTTSFGISVSQGTTITTTTSISTVSCTTDNGCQATGSTNRATTTGPCSTITATNAWVTCTGSSAGACTTTKTSVTSGCDATATTLTCSGKTTTTAVARRADDETCGEPSDLYAVYPRDAYDTANNDAIAAKLTTYASDPSEIYISKSKVDGGLNYWLLYLTQNQGDELSKLDAVSV